MKDSQLVAAGGLHFPKYIKESNERFSTPAPAVASPV